MTLCLVLVTGVVGECMDGIFAGNLSGRCKPMAPLAASPTTILMPHCLVFILLSSCLAVFSRGANFLTQTLLRPNASDLTGSFR